MTQKWQKAVRIGVMVTLVATMLAVSLPQPVRAQAGLMRMITGSYTGDGTDDRAISGLGFQPDVVFIKGDLGQVGVFRTSTMGDGYSKASGGTALFTDRIKSFGADGFTIGTDVDVNKAATSYYWAAFKTYAGEMTVSSYTGDGIDDRSISDVGFQPDFIIIMSAGSQAPVFRSSNVAGDVSYAFAGGTNSNAIQAFEADGFQVGTNDKVNNNGTDYHYIAWKTVAGRIAVGSYPGDGTDDRSITGVGFQPDWVIVHQEEGTVATRHKLASTAVDESQLFTGTANKNNEIQALEADGFQVGSAAQVNNASKTYQYAAFRNEPPYPDRYTGGSGDGFTILDSNLLKLDGTTVLREEKYAGGDGDGFSRLTSEVMTLGGTQLRYTGGSGDGFAILEESNLLTLGGTVALREEKYTGGDGDGFSRLTSEVITLGGTQLRYTGGSGDGFDTLESDEIKLFGIAVPGDTNWDGQLDATDITYIEHVVVMDAGYPETAGCDANEDGNVNALDITKTELLVP